MPKREGFEFYDHCEARGIEIYGGGQFELGPGRGQIQHLASLFHPDAPNDVAPKEYNDGGPRPGLPQSPLPPATRAFQIAERIYLGFRFAPPQALCFRHASRALNPLSPTQR